MKRGIKPQPRILLYSPYSTSDEPVVYTLDKSGNLTKEASELMKIEPLNKVAPCQITQDSIIDVVDDSYNYLSLDISSVDCEPNFDTNVEFIIESKDYATFEWI